MKTIRNNVPHTNGNLPCMQRYHDLRERTVFKSTVITSSDAKLHNRCKLGGVLKCSHPNDSEHTCHFRRG